MSFLNPFTLVGNVAKATGEFVGNVADTTGKFVGLKSPSPSHSHPACEEQQQAALLAQRHEAAAKRAQELARQKMLANETYIAEKLEAGNKQLAAQKGDLALTQFRCVLSRDPTHIEALAGKRAALRLLGKEAQEKGDLLSAVRYYREAQAPEEQAAADLLFETMQKRQAEAESYSQQKNPAEALKIYREIEPKLRTMQEVFPNIDLQADLAKFKDRIAILQSQVDSLQAKQLLAEIDADFELLQAQLTADLSGTADKPTVLSNSEAAERCQKKLASLEERYKKARELDPAHPSKHSELISIRDALETRIAQLKIKETEDSMTLSRNELEKWSLHNADHLPIIQQICEHWINLLATLPTSQKPLHEKTSLAMQEIYEQTSKASQFLTSLKTGSFLLEIVYDAIGEQGSFPVKYHPQLLALCKPLSDSLLIHNQWICLTPKGILSMRRSIKDRLHPFFKNNCFSNTFALKSHCRAIQLNEVEQWMKAALEQGKVPNILDILQVEADLPDFKEGVMEPPAPSTTNSTTPSAPSLSDFPPGEPD